MLSHVSGSCATSWTIACQAPLSMEFSRQEFWNGLPFPTPGDLPDPGIETTSLASPASACRFFTLRHHKMFKSSQFITCIIIQFINVSFSLEIIWSHFDKQRPLTTMYIYPIMAIFKVGMICSL